MNVIDLKRKFHNIVTTDWKDNKEVISKLESSDLERIVGVIDSFKDKKSVKEIAIIKFESLPIFVTVDTTDFSPFIDLLKNILVKRNMYEIAGKALDLQRSMNITQQ